jgi:hypothetical protein
MKFLLFSKLPFEIVDPVGLIENYCFQTNFYANYDAIPKRKIEDVNNIGARIPIALLPQCTEIIKASNNLQIFHFNIDSFLRQSGESIDGHVRILVEVIQRLTQLIGIQLSTATKILHTLYPNVIPIIDNSLKKKYKNDVNCQWIENDYFSILSDYYKNLRIDSNYANICQLYGLLFKSGLILSKIRIFDIIWWSYLKSKNPIQGKVINWSSIY